MMAMPAVRQSCQRCNAGDREVLQQRTRDPQHHRHQEDAIVARSARLSGPSRALLVAHVLSAASISFIFVETAASCLMKPRQGQEGQHRRHSDHHPGQELDLHAVGSAR